MVGYSYSMTKRIFVGVFFVASLAPLSAYANPHCKHLTGAKWCFPGHGHRVGTLFGGVTNDGGGFAIKNGKRTPIPPMEPVMPGGQIQSTAPNAN